MSNDPGVLPVEYKCLVLPITVEEVTAGGIIMPSQVVDAEQIAATEGTLVAAGGMAFDDWKDARKPQVGDKLLIAKYAGVTYKGRDKREYRILNDKDILAILE